MGSEQSFVEFVAGQAEGAGIVTLRKMFGEYALYLNGKVVALICDNQVFVKPTEKGRAFIGNVLEAPPYPQARMHFLIEDRLDDRMWFGELLRITFAELPLLKPKQPKKKAAPARGSKKTLRR